MATPRKVQTRWTKKKNFSTRGNKAPGVSLAEDQAKRKTKKVPALDDFISARRAEGMSSHDAHLLFQSEQCNHLFNEISHIRYDDSVKLIDSCERCACPRIRYRTRGT
jgi:hypothetical protein